MNFIHFKITGQDLCLDEISNTLNLQASCLYRKGESKISYGKNTTYEEDCWIYTIEVTNSMEESIYTFIDELYLHSNYLNALKAKNSTLNLVITYYIESYQTILSLSNNILQKISSIGLELYVDIMNL